MNKLSIYFWEDKAKSNFIYLVKVLSEFDVTSENHGIKRYFVAG